MMRGSYPHPVVDASDDVASTFEVFNLTYTPSVEDIEITFQVRTDDPTLDSLLREGLARFRFLWTCGSTLTTGELNPVAEQEYAESRKYTAFIDQRCVRGRVRLSFKVIAVTFIPEYRPLRVHDDYGEAVFEIEPGAILADGGVAEFIPGKLFDPLHPPLASCFRFVSEPRIRQIVVKFDEDDVVIVSFPQQTFLSLSALSHRPELQIALAVLPALTETIHFISVQLRDELVDELEDKAWYRSIKTLMMKQSLNFGQRPLDIAQRLLSNPIVKALGVAEEDDRD